MVLLLVSSVASYVSRDGGVVHHGLLHHRVLFLELLPGGLLLLGVSHRGCNLVVLLGLTSVGLTCVVLPPYMPAPSLPATVMVLRLMQVFPPHQLRAYCSLFSTVVGRASHYLYCAAYMSVRNMTVRIVSTIWAFVSGTLATHRTTYRSWCKRGGL